jgi:hypothetical protein
VQSRGERRSVSLDPDDPAGAHFVNGAIERT